MTRRKVLLTMTSQRAHTHTDTKCWHNVSFQTDKTPSHEMSGNRLGPAAILLTPDNHHPSFPSRFESILSNHPSVFIHAHRLSQAACMHVANVAVEQ